MSPQLSVQQLEHAITNLATLISAKELEISALSAFKEHGPAHVHAFLEFIHQYEDPSPESENISIATGNFFTAKLNRARVELEELEMQLKAVQAMRAQQSGIIVPGMNFRG